MFNCEKQRVQFFVTIPNAVQNGSSIHPALRSASFKSGKSSNAFSGVAGPGRRRSFSDDLEDETTSCEEQLMADADQRYQKHLFLPFNPGRLCLQAFSYRHVVSQTRKKSSCYALTINQSIMKPKLSYQMSWSWHETSVTKTMICMIRRNLCVRPKPASLYFGLGAVHKWRLQDFANFLTPSPLCLHSNSDIISK